MIKIKLCLLLMCLTTLQCITSKKLKGFSVEINDLIPEVIWMHGPVSQCLNIYNLNTIAIVNEDGDVTVAEFKDNEFVEKKENKGRFRLPCKEYASDPTSAYIWGYGVRDLQIINLDSGKIDEIVVSHGLNDAISDVILIDKERMELLVKVRTVGFNEKNTQRYWILYDINSKQMKDTCYGFSGIVFPLFDGTCMLEHFDSSNTSIWSIGTKELKTISENKLTKKLTELNIMSFLSNYSPVNKILIGTNKPETRTVFYSVNWDDKYEDVKIEPFTYQKGFDKIMSEHFQFSPDGKWAKTSTYNRGTGSDIDTITFFHVDSLYPQSLSFPVYGGSTVSTYTPLGCFLETPTWGTVYVDLSPDFPGYVIVYKMRDVLKKAREKTYTIERIR